MGSNDARDSIRVEVAYATPEAQVVLELRVQRGTTVEQVVEAAGLYRRFPDGNLSSVDVGIWGNIVDRGTTVRDGDRVELYRPLLMDPREARRLRAKGQD